MQLRWLGTYATEDVRMVLHCMSAFHWSRVAAGPVRLMLPLWAHAAVVVLLVPSKVCVRGGVRGAFSASWVT